MSVSQVDDPNRGLIPDPRRAFHPRWLLPLTIGLLLPLLALVLYWAFWGKARVAAPLLGRSGELAKLQQEHALLERDLLAVNEKHASLRAQCAPPIQRQAAPPPVPTPTPLPPEPVPAPPPQPVPSPAPEPQRIPIPEQQKGESLAIPPDLSKTKDMSFLKGCWQSITDLRSSRNNQPVIIKYCFDEQGRGERRIREEDGRDCVGSVSAAPRENGDVAMREEPAACPGGGGYQGGQTLCRRNDQGGTECTGRSGSHSWGATYVHQ